MTAQAADGWSGAARNLAADRNAAAPRPCLMSLWLTGMHLMRRAPPRALLWLLHSGHSRETCPTLVATFWMLRSLSSPSCLSSCRAGSLAGYEKLISVQEVLAWCADVKHCEARWQPSINVRAYNCGMQWETDFVNVGRL